MLRVANHPVQRDVRERELARQAKSGAMREDESWPLLTYSKLSTFVQPEAKNAMRRLPNIFRF